MPFRIHALPLEAFAPLLMQPEEVLHAQGARRVVADAFPGFPCRVSLQDAHVDEPLLLLPYRHLDGDTPYRASGPIFVREHARQAHPDIDEVPDLLRSRVLSVRAYDANGMMRAADVVEGHRLAACIDGVFADTRIQRLHLHYAKPGCYACRVERA